MRIYLVVNISQVVKYKELVKKQRVEKPKSVKVNREEEQKMKKISNKQIRIVTKYLVHWKEFIAEYNIQEKEKDLWNAKEVVIDFERKTSIEVRKQKKLKVAEE